MIGVRRRDQKKSAMLALLIGAVTRFIVGPICLFKCLKDGWMGLDGTSHSTVTFVGLVLMLVFFVSVEIYGVTRHQRLNVKLRALARESILAWQRNIPQQNIVQRGMNEVIDAVVGDRGRMQSTKDKNSNNNNK